MTRIPILALAVVTLVAGGTGASAAATNPPKGLTGIALDARVGLAWQPVGRRDLLQVYRGTTPVFDHDARHTCGCLTARSFTDSTATNGTTYYYVVRAVAARRRVGKFGCGSGHAGGAIVLDGATRSPSRTAFPGTVGWKLGSRPPVANGGIEGFANTTEHQPPAIRVEPEGEHRRRSPIQRRDLPDRLLRRRRGPPGSTISWRAGQASVQLDDDTRACYDCSTGGHGDASHHHLCGLPVSTSQARPRRQRLVQRDPLRRSRRRRHDEVLYGVPSHLPGVQQLRRQVALRLQLERPTTVPGAARGQGLVRPPFAQPHNIPRTTGTRARTTRPCPSSSARATTPPTPSTSTSDATAPVRDHRVYISGAHDEYYSSEIERSRAGARRWCRPVLQRLERGLLEGSLRGRTRQPRVSNRTLVCYKTTQGRRRIRVVTPRPRGAIRPGQTIPRIR